MKKWRWRLAVWLLRYDPWEIETRLRKENCELKAVVSGQGKVIEAARLVLHRVHNPAEVKACVNKAQFGTLTEAKQAAIIFWYKTGLTQEAYTCKVCRLYHTTSTNKVPTIPDYSERLCVGIGELLAMKKEVK